MRQLLLLLCLLVLAAGCTNEENGQTSPRVNAPQASPEAPAAPARLEVPAMGKSDGVFYEIFVRSFYDTDGNGIGDFNGVTEKLDYLVDLGIKGIWLMPITPSLTYHGYDATDYYDVNPDYGTMDDFKRLLDEADKRDIQVIMDLIVNHSSKEHPWFIESAEGKDNPKRNWYIWAEDQNLETSTLGAWGQKAWHTSASGHYLGIFWNGMPDLNFDNPEVRAEYAKIGQYWLELGVDGFRLDAAKHIYEDYQSSVGNEEVAKKNQIWWQEFRKAMLEINPDMYLIGEVWDSAAVIGPYFDNALDSAFHFDIAAKIINAVKRAQASDIGFDLSRVHSFYSKQSNGQFVDALFLTNHDQNRVMTELKGNVDQAKMAASILLTLPGNPFIYYGEEIGMKGAKPDERIREPMIWSDQPDPGQTSWELALHREGVIPVDQQLEDPGSLLNHYKTIIDWRNQSDILQHGGVLSYRTDNQQVMTYLRVYGSDRVLVVHNLSKEKQTVELSDETAGPFDTLLNSSHADISLVEGKLELPPYSTVIVK